MKVHEIINEGPGSFLLKGLGKLLGKGAGRTAVPSAGKAAEKELAKDATKLGAKAVEKSSIPTYTKFINAFGGFSGIAIKVFTADALYDFYTEYKSMVAQKEQFDKGDKTTELFANLTNDEAKKKYDDQLNSMVGKLVLIAAPQIRIPGIAGRLSKWIIEGGMGIAGGAVGLALGGPGGAAAGAAAGVGLGASGIGIVKGLQWLLGKGVTGAAFIGFVNSDAGTQFFSNILHGQLLTILGGSARSFFDSAANILSTFLGHASGNTSSATPKPPTANTDQPVNNQPATQTQPKVEPSTELSPEQNKIEQEFNSWPLKITFNGKQALANGMPLTDKNGYRSIDNYNLRSLQTTAKHMGKQFPMEIIPPKPGTTYYN